MSIAFLYVHASHIFHFRCPEGCSCIATTINCSNAFVNNDTSTHNIPPSTRYLDISYNPTFFHSISFDDIQVHYIIHLNVSA